MRLSPLLVASLTSEIVERLNAIGIHTVDSFFRRGDGQIVAESQLPIATVVLIREQLLQLTPYAFRVQTAASMLDSTAFLSSGVSTIDYILDGGFRYSEISQIYGRSATGKTQLCMTTAAAAACTGHQVFIFDSNLSYDAMRMMQLIEHHIDKRHLANSVTACNYPFSSCLPPLRLCINIYLHRQTHLNICIYVHYVDAWISFLVLFLFFAVYPFVPSCCFFFSSIHYLCLSKELDDDQILKMACDRIHLSVTADPWELISALETLRDQFSKTSPGESIVIVDGLGHLFSPYIATNAQAQALLTHVGDVLRRIMQLAPTVSLVTNYLVRGGADGEGGKPALGVSWERVPAVNIQMSRVDGKSSLTRIQAIPSIPLPPAHERRASTSTQVVIGQYGLIDLV
eukprot:m.152050 g.152050  ORF g.152050 m.152050 type:complete len:400 (-) comp16207_c0_seq1:389-1588(-)